jgi:hypothetical protein
MRPRVISLKDSLPASFEVSLIPLLLAYVFFGLGLFLSIYIALIGPVFYGLMCVFFLATDMLDGISLKLLAAKVLFILACLTPAMLVVAWNLR